MLVCLGQQWVRAESGDYFEEFEESMRTAQGARTALNNILDSDLLGGFDTPKEISISCPAEPVVKIKDIVLESDEQDIQKCSVIEMSGPNFKFRFEVNCNDED
jgi:hypothetical protein